MQVSRRKRQKHDLVCENFFFPFLFLCQSHFQVEVPFFFFFFSSMSVSDCFTLIILENFRSPCPPSSSANGRGDDYPKRLWVSDFGGVSDEEKVMERWRPAVAREKMRKKKKDFFFNNSFLNFLITKKIK